MSAVTPTKRAFLFEGRTLPDINPAFTPERVKLAYAGTYPDLASAQVSGPVPVDGQLHYTFARSIGAKG